MTQRDMNFLGSGSAGLGSDELAEVEGLVAGEHVVNSPRELVGEHAQCLGLAVLALEFGKAAAARDIAACMERACRSIPQ